MGNVLDILRKASTVAGAGVHGYAEDQQNDVAKALRAKQEARLAENDRVLNLMRTKPEPTPLITGKGGVRVADAPGVEVDVPQAPQHLTTGVGPDGKPIRVEDKPGVTPYVAPEKPNAGGFHEVTKPDGSKTLEPVTPGMSIAPPTKVAVKPLAAPMAAKVGQFGEMLKKYEDLTGSMESLDVGVGNSAARDLAEHGLHVPLFGTIPGTKGIGSALMSGKPEYARYQAALSPFILAAAHALSGARINQDQVEQIRKSIELAPGDFANKDVRAQKEKNLIDLINSIGGSLPADAIMEQEGQMSPAAIAKITERGYKPRKGAGGTTPPGGDDFTDAEVLAAHAAGKRTDADIAAWIRAKRGGG